MKPNFTSHVIRSALREIDPNHQVKIDALGFPSTELEFPSVNQSSSAFCKSYMIYNLARKRELSSASSAAMRYSIDKWCSAEWKCRVVNQHGRVFSPLCKLERSLFDTLSQRVRVNLSRLLSDIWPDLSVMEFTNGSSVELPRKHNRTCVKHSGTPPSSYDVRKHIVTCNPELVDILAEVLTLSPAACARYTRIHRAIPQQDSLTIDDLDPDRLAESMSTAASTASMQYVPKDIESVRLIAPTASGTMCIQKMFGTAIRRALMNVGVNLNDQTINQEWAEIGSLTGLVATIDLSSASDSIACRHLDFFPSRWQEYFMKTRDKYVAAGKTRHQLEMVAGMGNGFIFELESALFWAISTAVVEHLQLNTSFVSVYGDDIIIPSAATALLERYFSYLGFTVNETKSFSGTCKFRESCGKHYFNGVDVSPVYIKGDLDDEGTRFHYYNELSTWSRRTGVPLDKTLALIVAAVDKRFHFNVPSTLGTRSGFVRAPDLSPYIRTWYSKDYQRFVNTPYHVRTEHERNITDRFGGQTLLCEWFLGCESREPVIPYIACPILSVKYRHLQLANVVRITEKVDKQARPQKGCESNLGDVLTD